MDHKILAVDDDINFLNSLKINLGNIGYDVNIISNSSLALREVKNREYACILLDVKMPGVNGIDLLKTSLDENPTTPVLMVSGQSSIAIAVEAIKMGAFDFIEKPIDIQKLHINIKNAINKHELTIEKENLLSELKSSHKIVAESEKMKSVLNQIKTLAATSAKVLIQGETGTGKELIAWALHHNSDRSTKPYIKINCAAIPSELLESELFGHNKGAFTGAIENKAGKFLAADGGTLFLDEIGDMDLNLQSKILRVLESNEVDVIGETKSRKIDVRIISATNKNLNEKIVSGTFREDLYYRLNVMNIIIPPLRERKADIIPLTEYFVHFFNSVYNKHINRIDKEAENILTEYEWKGNIRELRNTIEKAIIFSTNSILGYSDLNKAMSHLEKPSILHSEESSTLKDAKLTFEREYILKILTKNKWKINQTAEELGIDRTNLFKKMQNLGIKKN